MLNEYDIVRLLKPLGSIPKGTLGTVLIVYKRCNESPAYEVEFADEKGRPVSKEVTITIECEYLEKV